MISEPFAIGNSIIHRLDPRIRVGLTSVYAFVVALSYRFSVLMVALVISSVLIVISQVSVTEVFKRVIWVNVLIFLLWLLLPLTFRGEVLTHIGSIAIYRPGVVLAAQITLKSNAILLAFIALVATMSFATVGHALYRLRVPEKIVYLLLMTYRYVFVIEQEYQRLVRATKIRGFRPGTNANTYRTYAYIVGMLFVRAAARAERVHQAMLCRGFKGKFYSLQEFHISTASWIFAVFMATIIVGLVIMEWSNFISFF
ncbi:MAG: cobalt ECF transporter T component CbiQ [Deltaproteobacteria bacterium]|nr:cobalt ECF transporter T component CbiQ [Deltaproteobacteria bacterium]